MDTPEQIARWAGPLAMFVTAGGALFAFFKFLFNAGSWMEALHGIKEKVMDEIADLKAAVKADTERAIKVEQQRAAEIKQNTEMLYELSDRVGRIEGHLRM